MSAEKMSVFLKGVWARLEKTRLEVLFLLIFVPFSVLFAALIPPGWNTDEANHTYRIYQLAAGDLLSEKVVDPQTGIKAYGGNVPTGLLQLYAKTGALTPGGLGNPNNKIDKHVYAHHPEIFSLKDNGARISINFSGAALYSPVTYMLYLPVVLLGKLFALPFFWVVMLCRLAGIVLLGAAFFAAIRYAPVGKWIFFAVGLLPSVLIQGQSVGADASELAVCVLFTVAVMRLIYQPRALRWFDYAFFVAAGIALTLIKIAYVPMLLLLGMLPLLKPLYRDRKTLALLAATFVVAVLPSIIWSQLVSYIDINSNPQADFQAQQSFVLSQPLTYLATLYHTFFTVDQTALDNLFGSYILLPAIYSYLAAVVLVLSLFVRGRREAKSDALTTREQRLWCAVLLSVSAITTVFIATALYIYSTTLHQSSIVGIQSRYFLPLLPLIALVFYGNTLKNQRAAKIGIVIMNCLVLVGMSLAIYHRLYEPLPLLR
jgi:uncharacterized membrane protein